MDGHRRPPPSGAELGRTALIDPAGCLIVVVAIVSAGAEQAKVPTVAPLTATVMLPVVPVLTVSDPEFPAVIALAVPARLRGSEEGGGLGIGVEGITKLAFWLVGVPPVAVRPNLKLPERVSPLANVRNDDVSDVLDRRAGKRHRLPGGHRTRQGPGHHGIEGRCSDHRQVHAGGVECRGVGTGRRAGGGGGGYQAHRAGQAGPDQCQGTAQRSARTENVRFDLIYVSPRA